MFKLIKNIIPILFFGIIIFLGISFFNGFSLENIIDSIFGKTKVTSETISEKISSISNLTTFDFTYTDLVKHGKPKPAKGDYYVAIIKGRISAGIDFSKIEILNNVDGNYTIKVPHSIITKSEITEINEKKNDGSGFLFDDIDKSKIINWQSNKHTEVEKQLINSGFLIESDKRAKKIISNFLKGLGLENFNIIYF